MKSLHDVVKSADWKSEKHVPVIDAPESFKAGDWVEVSATVGKEIPHPNTTEHHICWIALHFVPDGAGRTLGDNFYRDVKAKEVQEEVDSILRAMK